MGEKVATPPQVVRSISAACGVSFQFASERKPNPLAFVLEIIFCFRSVKKVTETNKRKKKKEKKERKKKEGKLIPVKTRDPASVASGCLFHEHHKHNKRKNRVASKTCTINTQRECKLSRREGRERTGLKQKNKANGNSQGNGSR